MASTNKTTNILLSQFLGTDHFSFLTDYNGDMLKIDTYCGNLKALIDGESSKTEQNTESIQNVQRDIQSIQTVQERQNGNITNNTTDIAQLKKDNTENKANIAKNTQDIKNLQNGRGARVVLDSTTTEWKMGDTNVYFYYDPNTKNIHITSKGVGFIQALSGLKPTGTVRINVSKITDNEVVARLQKGSAITITCGWLSCLAQITIDGTIETFPVEEPITLKLYGSQDNNTVTGEFRVGHPLPTGSLVTGECNILLEGTVPMAIYV